MSFNGSGTFNLYATGNPVVTGTTVSASWANNTLSDIATGLSNCITRDGQSPATANIPMGSHKITGLAAGTTAGDSVRYEQVTSAVAITGGAIDGATIGATTPSTGAFTTLSASSTVSGTGFSTYFASPPAIGSTSANTGAFTTLSASSTVTLSGGTANGVAYLNGSKVLTTGSALVFDGSNFGLGVTPSAWTGTFKAIQLPDAGVFGTQNQNLNLIANATYNSGWKYISTASATMYSHEAGKHYWFTAPSGTAGSAISFTQAMTLDASGNLGIGTSSTSYKLHVNGTSGNPQMQIQTASGGAFLQFNGYDSANAYCMLGGSTATGGVFGTQSNIPVAFYTNNTERARIDTSGNLLVGTTGIYGGSRLSVDGGTGNGAGINVAVGASGVVLNSKASGNYYPIAFQNNGTGVGNVYATTTTTTYNTSSDYRLKNTIAPMQNALAKVAQLKPVTYKWNADNSDGQGFIAHELQAVIPEAVTGEKDAVDADGNPVYQGIDPSKIVATLTAALQEQQAIIESLQARITTLEGK